MAVRSTYQAFAILKRLCFILTETIYELMHLLMLALCTANRPIKTVEVTRLQTGNSDSSARIVVSTLAEAEHLIGSRHEWIDGAKSEIDVRG